MSINTAEAQSYLLSRYIDSNHTLHYIKMLHLKGSGYKSSIDLTHIDKKDDNDSVSLSLTIEGKDIFNEIDSISIFENNYSIPFRSDIVTDTVFDKTQKSKRNLRMRFEIPFDTANHIFKDRNRLIIYIHQSDNTYKLKSGKRKYRKFKNAIKYWYNDVYNSR